MESIDLYNSYISSNYIDAKQEQYKKAGKTWKLKKCLP